MKQSVSGRLLSSGALVLASFGWVACSDGGGAMATGAGGGGGQGGSAPLSCPAERTEAIGPLDKVSEGEILVLSDTNGVKTLYVDASAGGAQAQEENPWLYLRLATASRVNVSDVQADASVDWDLALKRPEIRTNSGPGAAGSGGAVFLKDVAFDAVTKESAAAATPLVEDWFEGACVLKVDPGGYIRTTFDGWYDYGGEQTHAVSPHPGTFIVWGGKGTVYKLELQGYYSNPDGTDGMVSARFKLQYAPL